MPLLSLNELGEMSQRLTILSNFVNKSFRKRFFIDQSLKGVLVTYCFDELLIFF